MILVTGATGQLGHDVVSELERRGIESRGVGSADLDITCSRTVRDYLTLHRPNGIIHCAAYTAVDKAEDEPELCMRVNSEGTENLAAVCREINAEMLYISTDYVFGGEGDAPYETDAQKNPLSVYGKSKLAGEETVIDNLDKHYIVRVSWLFGQYGNNFVNTMLKLAQTRDTVNVISDQIGSPTCTADLASLLCDIIMSGKYGVYHATNEGFCSWAEFAGEIMKVIGSTCKVVPITSEQYSAKAVRPKNSRLSKLSLYEAGFIRLPNWRTALERYLKNNWG